MELVYCFIGMVILCVVMGIIAMIITIVSDYRGNIERADRYFGWLKSFMYCGFYFLVLEIAARFFA